MKPELETEPPRMIHIAYEAQFDQLVIDLTQDGIEYLQRCLNDLQTRDAGAHWHFDDFTGTLSGDFKHMVIQKTEG